MILLGLAGHAGCGKDTVADYLVERYGFIKFSFTDALYREVARAFGLEDEPLLWDREAKDKPHDFLALEFCTDEAFMMLAAPFTSGDITRPNSPRRILQLWGTEYRREQDPDYWIRQAEEWLHRVYYGSSPYPELRPQYFVNTSVRFPNEQQWAREHMDGNLWHIRRDTAAPVASHVSETPLPVLEGEREVWNNYTIEYLHMGIDQLLMSNIPSICIEPPERMEAPKWAPPR